MALAHAKELLIKSVVAGINSTKHEERLCEISFFDRGFILF